MIEQFYRRFDCYLYVGFLQIGERTMRVDLPFDLISARVGRVSFIHRDFTAHRAKKYGLLNLKKQQIF